MSTARIEGREFELGQDNQLHSVRHDSLLWDALKGNVRVLDRTEGAHRRFGQVIKDVAEMDKALERLFTRYESARDDLEDAGVVAEAKLSPALGAAYGAWRAHRGAPKRVELSQISEAPLPPEGE
jgi:hypothetical protein